MVAIPSVAACSIRLLSPNTLRLRSPWTIVTMGKLQGTPALAETAVTARC